MNRIICGDALETLKTLPGESTQMCVTSPPYYALRDYEATGQIGLEQTPEEYIARLVDVFRELRRVLKPDGTLWLNIGDSYAGGAGRWGKENGMSDKQAAHKGSHGQIAARWKHDSIKQKDMIGIPWALAFAMRDDGWYLRSDIIWRKPNPFPESVTDRPSKSYEHLFLLSKSPRYYYDSEAIKEPVAEGTVERKRRGLSADHKYANGTPGQTAQGINRPRAAGSGIGVTMRNKRDVWDAVNNGYRGAHFATFPEKLIEPCILAGSKPGDTVIDIFFGSGTTGAVALKFNRQYIGIDINPDYCNLAENRIKNLNQEVKST